jgi:hypothetical protein
MYKVENSILHIIYNDKKDEIYHSISKWADEYEGKVNNRIGVNFPLTSKHKNLFDKYGKASYLVMYKKGDVNTKLHELQHARYYLDSTFRAEVQSLWEKIEKSSKNVILGMLKRMGYPDHPDILIDEFQAYYFTEKPNFFGKIKYII